MKTLMMTAACALLLLASCSKKNDSLPRPVANYGKTINFSISQSRDYADPVFNGVMAEVKLAVTKVNKQDGQTLLLWDSTIAYQSLRSFPEMQQPAGFTKTFSGIDDNRENISASYWISYRDAENRVTGEGRNEFAPLGASVLSLPVRL